MGEHPDLADESRRGTQRGTQGGPWAVTDYDDKVLPGRWPTEELARDEGLCGRYLLSGLDVVRLDGDHAPCPCVCCVEQGNLLAHGRALEAYCSCSDHPEDEQCDCAWCVKAMPQDVARKAALAGSSASEQGEPT